MGVKKLATALICRILIFFVSLGYIAWYYIAILPFLPLWFFLGIIIWGLLGVIPALVSPLKPISTVLSHGILLFLALYYLGLEIQVIISIIIYIIEFIVAGKSLG